MLNPMAGLLEGYRDVLLRGQSPDIAFVDQVIHYWGPFIQPWLGLMKFDQRRGRVIQGDREYFATISLATNRPSHDFVGRVML